MPKRGERHPWRLTYQYGTQDKPSSNSYFSQGEAERRAGEMLGTAPLRGTSVALTITNRDTGESYTYPQGEIMTDRNDVTTEAGAQVIEQIDANIERARSLTDAEALSELKEETETLISSLSGKGSIKVKTDKRAAFTEAADTMPEDVSTAVEVKAKPAEGVVVKTWDQYEGVKELVTMGAEKVAEGVRLHRKTSDLAKEVAAVTFDMWVRIPNKDGIPDIKGNSDQAKKAAGEMYRLAGEGFEHNFENENALEKLQRSVQMHRTDVRANWLRELNEDTTDGAEARALYGERLNAKPEDMDVSEFVATKLYESPAMLKGEGEKQLERYHAKQKAKALASGETTAEVEGASKGEAAETTTPDERVEAIVKRLKADVHRAKPEDFEAASEETRKSAREELEILYQAVKDMITATL
jgi:hypothetical protein